MSSWLRATRLLASRWWQSNFFLVRVPQLLQGSLCVLNVEPLLIQVPSRLDGKTADNLEAQLPSLIPDNCIHVIIDLALVDFISSSGIRFLVVTRRLCQKRGGVCVLCCLREQILDVLTISGLTGIFPTFDDAESAKKSLEAEQPN